MHPKELQPKGLSLQVIFIIAFFLPIFRKLFSDQNGNGNGNGNGTGNTIFNIPKLSNTQSLFSNSDTGSALTADTISDKNNPFASQQDGSTSIFYRNVPKFTLNTEPGSPFGKPSNETVTPKFRINLRYIFIFAILF